VGDMGDKGLIVVGVDGSASSMTALEFALGEAARRGARVKVVTAFEPVLYWPVTVGMAASTAVLPSPAELAEDAERTARQAVIEVSGRVGGAAAAVPVEVWVAEGSPAKALLRQAAAADLLVVGHRGRGAIASACLGSVGLQCVLHATCPVVVVRPTTASCMTEPAVAAARTAT
jgi:nucleotide-binding universal stress UspA family protein